MARRRTMERVKTDRLRVRGAGFIMTWDVDSSNRAMADRVTAFLWGKRVRHNGREYVYPGFIGSEGVRYVGQSVIFVLPHRLATLRSFLISCGITPVVDAVTFH